MSTKGYTVTKHIGITAPNGELIPAINPDEAQDWPKWNKAYLVHLTMFNTLAVFARNETDALDEAVDYAEDQGWEGCFCTPEYEQELIDDGFEDEILYAGNHGRPLYSPEVHIEEVN